MKAERRHELQTNQLATVLARFPDFWARYGSRILLVVLAAIVAFWLVSYQRSQARQTDQWVAESLTQVRSQIREIGSRPVTGLTPNEVYADRSQQTNVVEQALDEVINQADDRSMQAQALVARGDLYWALATAPVPQEPPATQPTTQATTQATTQPANVELVLRPISPEAHLDNAVRAYEQVLQQYTEHPYAIAAARFGLAAVAEQRGDFDQASKHYQAVVDDQALPVAYRNQASAQLERLPSLRQRVVLAPPSTQPIAPQTTGMNDLSLMLDDLRLGPDISVEAPAPAPLTSGDPNEPATTQPAAP